MREEDRVRGSRVVVGVGNPLRRDDGAGVWVARQLAGAPGWVTIPAGLALENVIGKIEKLPPKLVVVVDAAELGLPPGEFRRLPWEWRGGGVGAPPRPPPAPPPPKKPPPQKKKETSKITPQKKKNF